MKKYSIFLAIAALIFASLACQTVMGGGKNLLPTQPPLDGGGLMPATVPPIATEEDGSGIQVPTLPAIATDENGGISIGGTPDFPIPDDATNVVNMGETLITFQTKLSLTDAMKFYRDAFDKLGYTERKGEAFTSDSVFSMNYDDKNGKVVSVQGVDMSGATSITIMVGDK